MNKKTDDEKVKVQDKSNDKKYFIVTPRLVWALCEDPYEYTFWSLVKDIAGEDGECYLSREDMATLSMMSSGMATKCRESLFRKRLLQGELKRDPGYPQSVWHLSIPDFWEANIRWARKYPKIAERIAFKREQRAIKEASRGDGLKDASRGDGGIPPGDGGIPPGDAKNNVLEDPKEKIWRLVQESLESEMARVPYDSYVGGAQLISCEDGLLIVLEPNAQARDWAEERLTTTIERLLVGILNHESPEVKFIVKDQVEV